MDYMVSGIVLFDRRYYPRTFGSDAERDYVIAYEAGGFLSLIGRWILADCAEPLEDIIDWMEKHTDDLLISKPG